MRLKLDENLPEALGRTLSALGHDVDNLRLEVIAGRDDPTVWHAAQEAGRLALVERITELFRSEDVEAWTGAFVVLSAHKLRVRSAPIQRRLNLTQRPRRKEVGKKNRGQIIHPAGERSI